MTPRLLGTVAAFALALQPAAAQEVIDEIQVTATRIPATVTDVPTGVTLIPAEDIAAGALVTDALGQTAGVYLQQTTPGQGVAIIRGLKGSEVLHLVDGIRLNNAIFRNAPTQYLALLAPVWVERIEVVRGSEASLYGSDAMGGVVQVLSRKPAFEGTDHQSRGRIAIGGNTGERGGSVAGNVETGNERFAMLASIDYRNIGDRRTGDGETVEPSGFESEAARLAFTGRPADDLRWLLDVQYLRQPETPRVDELVPGFGQTEPSSAEFFFEPNERHFVHFQGERTDGPLGSDWRLDLAWQQIVDDRRNRETGSEVRRFENNRSDLFGLTLNGARQFGGTSWTWGAEWYYDTVSSTRTALDLATGATEAIAARFPDGSTMEQRAVYVHALSDIGERHRISAGLRYSSARIELTSTATSPAATLTPDDVSGDIGWVYRLDDRWNLVANVGRGFRAPNIFDLGTLGPRPGNRFNIANTSLGPEQVYQYDIGFKGAGDGWQFEFMMYRLDYRDRITSVLTGETTPDGRDIVQSRNLAEAEIWGVESGLRLRWSERWGLDAVLNYTYGEEREPGSPAEPADRIPPLNGRLGLTWEPVDRLELESYLEFAAAQNRLAARDIRDVRIDPEGTPGWTTLNFHATWRPEANWRIRLAAENVLDKAYRTHGSGIDAVGRSVAFNVSYDW